MACPFFEPVTPLGRTAGEWRVPLGELHAGFCRSGNDALEASGECCNLGYARRSCDRFPKDSAVDAVRYGVANDDGTVIRLHAVRERNYAPAGYELLAFDRVSGSLQVRSADARINSQAAAFAEAYIRRSQ